MWLQAEDLDEHSCADVGLGVETELLFRAEARNVLVEATARLGRHVDVGARRPIGAALRSGGGPWHGPGELLALRWSDVDLDAGKATVRHTLRRGVRTLAAPKTDGSKRTLHLGSVAATLRLHRTRQLEERIAAGHRWQDGDFVFATKFGEPLDTSTVTRSFQAALRRAGLPRQRFHDLRHCFATLHLEAGEELLVVSRALGHSTISTTADVYANVTPAMLERTAERMDGILGRKVDTA